MSKKKKDKVGDFGKYEIMDRASVIMENFNKFIVQTEAVKKDKALKKAAVKVFEKLLDFYQVAANSYWDSEK